MSLTDAYSKMIDGLNHCLMNPQSMNRALVKGFKELSNASGDIGGKVEYSTTEHEIGTWTDGSKLYEITINYTCLDNSNYQNVVEFPTTNEVKEVSAVFESATHEAIPGVWAGSIFWQWGIAVAGDSKRYVMVKRNTSDANWKTATLNMTIRYTKAS